MGVATNFRGTETKRTNRTNNATAWTPSNSSRSAHIRSRGDTHDEEDSASQPESISRGVVAYRREEHAVNRQHTHLAEYTLSFFQQSIAYSAWAVTHPVSAVEHHWAMRATRAEALLDAHAVHRHEISSLEERRSRELAELNRRHLQVYARQQMMVWSLLGTALAAISALLYFLYQRAVPAGADSRLLGPLHFTIPILSPFASVIEHETSFVNVQLVAVLLLAAASFALLWFRCGRR
ncbi:hypothetical protein VTO73DRAFT_12331 [Trametes versicolor]